MKTYKDLNTLTEIAQAMDAGKVVERQWKRGNPTNSYYWEKPECISRIDVFDWNYRTVEETELPEQGDEMGAWDINKFSALSRKFIGFVDCWESWKPIDKKPVPREWYIREGAPYLNACVKRRGEMTFGDDFIHVIEVLEDE